MARRDPEARKEYQRAYYLANRAKFLHAAREHASRQADSIRARRKLKREAQKECDLSRLSEWRSANPQLAAAAARQWQAKNRDRLRAIWREMARRKRARVAHGLHNRIACGVWRALRGQRKTARIFTLLGYDAHALREHLEKQFLPGMSWSNASVWHIDHIVPVSAFRITGPDCPELKRAWALTNLRPLWAADNLRKRAKREFLI